MIDWKKMEEELDGKKNSDLYFCVRLSRDRLQNEKQLRIIPDRLIIAFIDKGKLLLTLDGRDLVLRPHQLLVLRPRQQGCVAKIEGQVTVFIIGFLPVMQEILVKQFSTAFFTYVQNHHPVWDLSERVTKAIHSFYDLFEFNCCCNPGQFSTEISNSLFNIFLQSFYNLIKKEIDQKVVEGQTPSNRTLGGRFFQLLNTYYRKEHTVTFYANEMCISSKYLTQVVKHMCGLTPKDLIDRRLGMEALFLLTKTDKNIQEVSNELGFPDQSYFGRFFKRLFGMAPLHYRLNPDLRVMERLTSSEI